jgi:hypothetical protein
VKETVEQAWERAMEIGFLLAWEDGYISCPYVPYVPPGKNPRVAKRPKREKT